MLHCPNPHCPAINAEFHKFCQTCGTFLPKHYLWAVGNGLEHYRPGDTLADRFLCKGHRIFLDTQPSLMPEPYKEIPSVGNVYSYLRLSPYRLHLPEFYEWVDRPGQTSDPILLLNESALVVTVDDSQQEVTVHLLPTLSQQWASASGLRQLHWLWQIAQLWQPFSTEHVAASLLNVETLRVEGSILRLLELTPGKTPSLVDLGQLWLQWLPTAKPDIAPFLENICQALVQGHLSAADQLSEQLDLGLVVAGRSLHRRIEIATRTDQGPSRKRNEDSCYPPHGTVQSHLIAGTNDPPSATNPLVVVCDGIGGHQGGDVASGLAIAAIHQQLTQILPGAIAPDGIVRALEQATQVANDAISARNDNEHRQERQRMGTTLVMGLVHQHELYVTHVGDSRAYWISRYGCHQITLDDDIATREVRLGYGSYRQAIQQPISGSLVQALGMGPSSLLHPTTQRFILDDDGIFLLCSDGLSDFDRVEESWETILLPVIEGRSTLHDASQALVQLANTRNGHDNVTVGLIYCQVSQQTPIPVPAELNLTHTAPPSEILHTPPDIIQQPPTQPAPATQANRRPGTSNGLGSLLFSILLLLGIAGGLVYIFFPGRVEQWLGFGAGSQPSTPPDVATTASEVPDTPADGSVAAPLLEDPTSALDTGDFIQVADPSSLRSQAPVSPDAAEPILLYEQPILTAPSSETGVLGQLPVGSVAQVIRRQQRSPDDSLWLQLKICRIPPIENADSSLSSSEASPESPESPSALETAPVVLVQAGDMGWIAEEAIAPFVRRLPSPTVIQQGACTSSAIPSTNLRTALAS
jgi:serine/threonine protein phosphatase PrpC